MKAKRFVPVAAFAAAVFAALSCSDGGPTGVNARPQLHALLFVLLSPTLNPVPGPTLPHHSVPPTPRPLAPKLPVAATHPLTPTTQRLVPARAGPQPAFLGVRAGVVST